MKAYHPSFHGVMVCIGGRYGLALVGGDKKKFALPSFFAMFVKHLINIVYFTQVLGWNKVFSYLRHEFFTIRKKRSFVGCHFSNRTPSFMLLQLRLLLGGTWLFEAVVKIQEGWLHTPKLTGFFSGAAGVFERAIQGANYVPDAAAGASTEAVPVATDAVASASTAVAETAGAVAEAVWDKALINWDIFGLIRSS
jgi:NADH dehydrogenase